MNKNSGPDIEDRGVEARSEILDVNGERIVKETPPAIDGLGNPAAAEDAGAD